MSGPSETSSGPGRRGMRGLSRAIVTIVDVGGRNEATVSRQRARSVEIFGRDLEVYMDLKTRYPALATLADTFGYDLNAIAAPPASPTDLLGLRTSCWWVATGQPRNDDAADPYGYLKTFDELLVQFTDTELDREKFWHKLNHPTGSSFLDTVGEASAAIHLRCQQEISLDVMLEVQFQLASGEKKDADIVTVSDGGGKSWLDVVSIKPDEFDVPQGPYSPVAYANTVVDLLASRIKRKYKSKFKDAVFDGVITDPVGVIVCMLKCEEILAPLEPLRQMGLAPSMNAPLDLWTDRPGLVTAFIHTVRKRMGTDLLVPAKFETWLRPAPPT